jgi:hypothetical protein
MVLQFGDVENSIRIHRAADALEHGESVWFNVVLRLPLHTYYNWLKQVLRERGRPDAETLITKAYIFGE